MSPPPVRGEDAYRIVAHIRAGWDFDDGVDDYGRCTDCSEVCEFCEENAEATWWDDEIGAEVCPRCVYEQRVDALTATSLPEEPEWEQGKTVEVRIHAGWTPFGHERYFLATDTVADLLSYTCMLVEVLEPTEADGFVKRVESEIREVFTRKMGACSRLFDAVCAVLPEGGRHAPGSDAPAGDVAVGLDQILTAAVAVTEEYRRTGAVSMTVGGEFSRLWRRWESIENGLAGASARFSELPLGIACDLMNMGRAETNKIAFDYEPGYTQGTASKGRSLIALCRARSAALGSALRPIVL